MFYIESISGNMIVITKKDMIIIMQISLQFYQFITKSIPYFPYTHCPTLYQLYFRAIVHIIRWSRWFLFMIFDLSTNDLSTAWFTSWLVCGNWANRSLNLESSNDKNRQPIICLKKSSLLRKSCCWIISFILIALRR